MKRSAPTARLSLSIGIPLAMLLLGAYRQEKHEDESRAEPLDPPKFEFGGISLKAPGEQPLLEIKGEVIRLGTADKDNLRGEVALRDVGGKEIVLRWNFPRKVDLDLPVGRKVEIQYRRQQGFKGVPTGILIRDEAGPILLADDGAYGNALTKKETSPFEISQEDAGCRNRANRPGSLNNFRLVVKAGNNEVKLIHGKSEELEHNKRKFHVLAVKSTARVGEEIWTDAPYNEISYIIARNPGTK